MNKRGLICTYILITCLPCLAQNGFTFTGYRQLPVKTPDSLLQKLTQAHGIKEKIQAAQPLLAFHSAHGTTDSVIFYSQQLIDALNQSSLKSGDKLTYQATLYHTLANAYSEQGLHDEALRFYLEGIRTAELLGSSAAGRKSFAGSILISG